MDEDREAHLLSSLESRPACLTIAADSPMLYGSRWLLGRVTGRDPDLTILTTCLPPRVWVHPFSIKSRIALRWSSNFAMDPHRTTRFVRSRVLRLTCPRLFAKPFRVWPRRTSSLIPRGA